MTTPADTPILIMNPNAGNGSTAKRVRGAETELRKAIGTYQIRATQGPGDATALTRAALQEGHRWIVAVGGDGTINEVVNGFFDTDGGIIGEPMLSLFPSGTGGDFRKTWGLGRSASEAIQRMATAAPRWMDAGRVSWKSPEGETRHRYFANIASIGLGARASDQANRQSKVLGGKVSFYVASFRALMGWSNIPITVQVDEQESLSLTATTVAVCNGQFFGGGMQAAPNANPSDGLFDVIIMNDFSRLELIRLTSIYKGQHLGHPKIQQLRGRVVRIGYDGSEPSPMEAEGEVFGTLPAEFEVLPKAFRIKV